MIKWLR
jgi:hypothetical protein